MRVLIVDDEPLAVESLRRRLERFPDVTVVGEAFDGDEALRQVEALAPDLVLLDIQMPGQTGISVARALARTRGPEVAFVTAYANFAPEAFELEAADYLLKPVKADRLEEAVNRARRRLHMRGASDRLEELEDRLRATEAAAATAAGYDSEVWIRQREGFVRVPVADIRRIEADRDYAMIHTGLKSYILRSTMAALEKRLDPRHIVRVHRSAFVRLDTVRSVELERGRRKVVRLRTEDGAVVEVGASYADRLAAALRLNGLSLTG